MGLGKLEIDGVIHNEVSGFDAFVSQTCATGFVCDDPRETFGINLWSFMRWFVTLSVISCFCVHLPMVSVIQVWVGPSFHSWCTGVTKGSLSVAVVEHGDVGFESLSNRLRGSILSSRDGLGEFVDCAAFASLSASISIDDVKAGSLD